MSQANEAAAQISFARPDIDSSVSVSSNEVTRWRLGQYEVLHLRGSVEIRQQNMTAAGDEAILWVETPDANAAETTWESSAPSTEHKIIAYLEGQVVVDLPRPGGVHQSTGVSSDRIVDDVWLGRFFTRGMVEVNQVANSLAHDQTPPAIFGRAQSALEQGASTATQQTGFTAQQSLVVSPQTGAVQQITPTFQVPTLPDSGNSPFPNQVNRNFAPPAQTNNSGLQAFQTDRSGTPYTLSIDVRDATMPPDLSSKLNPDNPNERVNIFVGGIRVAIDSPQIANAPSLQMDRDRNLYIDANNLVHWESVQPDGSKRNQFYLEGNVVFAKGSRVIYAERMFYDADAQQGTILKAEMITTVPDYRGSVRLKADVVQQYDENNLQAFGSAFTSSRMGVPRYWLQSESIGIQRTQIPLLDPETSAPQIDLQTGLYQTQDDFIVDSQQNRVYLGGLPVFAWPRLRTSLSDPTLYLDRFSINNDSVFGFQVKTGFNMYQILGLERPPQGTRWIGLVDYLSDRGLGVGSEFDYELTSLFGVPGKVTGNYNSWFLSDDGLDNLGLGRRNLVPEEDFRGRSILKHRHDFYPGYQLRAEFGYISDRNFLEQFYEREWDTQKDATTGIWLERNAGTQSLNLTADLQINDFFTQTSGLNLKQFVIGQPVFNNRAIWHSSSQAGYVRMRQADPPTTATELAKFDPLAWEADVDGFRAGTRHEIDFPNQIGPVKVVPYLLGDASYWQEDLTGNDLARVYGQTGIRASVPLWRVDPSIQSTLWNVNGLAHKISFDVDAFFSDASQDLGELPLYDQLDDDSQEHFRRRFAFDTFGILPGGDVPFQFDERNFAFRSGMQGNVTAASSEIADDLAAIKFGIRQRWQTKRGLPGRERIIDWITLDAQTILYPDADRDNFGSEFGMFDYDFRWHVGDRLSLVSDGYFDFFSQGLRTASFGANIGRPEIGNAYLGYRMIEGPISSNILSAALTYRMSDKWGVKAGGQIDFGETGTIGQALNLIYIGESFLWQFGFNYDASRDNLGFRFGFEPRFARNPRIFRPGGVPIAPAGAEYLE